MCSKRKERIKNFLSLILLGAIYEERKELARAFYFLILFLYFLIIKIIIIYFYLDESRMLRIAELLVFIEGIPQTP